MKIETTRLTMRNFFQSDVSQFFEIIHNDTVKKYLSGTYCKTLEDAKELINLFSNFDNSLEWNFAVCKDDELIGFVSAMKALDNKAEVCYLIAEKHKGHHYAAEAVEGLLKWLKENTKIKEVCMLIKADNNASLSVAKQLGAKLYLDGGNQKNFRIIL